jgi:putative transcriptional regulator
MSVSYKKLWKLLIDKDMKKKDLQKVAKLSPSIVAKLGRNENISMDVLGRICLALECNIEEVMEFIPDNDQAI